MTRKSISFLIPEAVELAGLLHQRGELSRAEMLYRRILQAVPDDCDTLHALAVLSTQQQRFADAADLIGRIIALDPANPDAYNNLGNVWLAQGEQNEAEACYRQAINLRPSHASALNNLGVVLAGQQRLDESLRAHHQAVAAAPNNEEFLFNLGNALLRADRLNEAVSTFRAAITIDPAPARTWQRLARTYLVADRHDLAAEVYEEWLSHNPGDPTISYLLHACRGDVLPEKAPEAYVQQLFDTVAEQFDTHLGSLDYRAPDLLCAALAAELPPPAATLQILDVGCGTGLCGPMLRPFAQQLTGVDLSTGMLERADARQLYDRLIMAELTGFMARNTGQYDVIVSADTLCYFGELLPLLTIAAAALKPGGLLAFTLEATATDAATAVLMPTGRYKHPRGYVEEALITAGLTVHSYSTAPLRKECGEPVEGHLYVVRNGGETR